MYVKNGSHRLLLFRNSLWEHSTVELSALVFILSFFSGFLIDAHTYTHTETKSKEKKMKTIWLLSSEKHVEENRCQLYSLQ